MNKFFFTLILTFASSVFLISCKKDKPTPPVLAKAEFTFSGDLDSIPAQIQFTNNSSGISYIWDFGDGSTSIEKNPTHTYKEYGLYKVKLTAKGSSDIDSLFKDVLIGGNLGQIGSIDCANIINKTDFKVGESYTNELIQISYTNGNGGVYNGFLINSSGVLGLSAKLIKGKFNNGNGNLELSISGTPTTSGYAKFAINLGGKICDFSILVLANIITLDVNGISSSSAIGGGNIISDGGSAITQSGVCWSTSPNPTTANEHTVDGTGGGKYSSTIQPLSPVTTYYVRAYATSNLGTSYGNQITFKTTKFCINGNCIGDNFQGGLIAYFLTPGDNGYDPNVPHGFIVAAQDQSASSNWSNAKTICDDLVLNGYSDWYLPGRGEFQAILYNLYLTGLINISSNIYWTSNEYWTSISQSTPFAEYFNFYGNGGSWSYERKTNNYHVRAVRNF